MLEKQFKVIKLREMAGQTSPSDKTKNDLIVNSNEQTRTSVPPNN